MSAIGWIGENIGGAANINMPPGGFKVASQYQNNLGVDVIVTVLNGEWDGGTSGIHIKGFAYTDTAGAPDALVEVTNERTTVIAGTNIPTPFTFVNPWTWPAGALRWLGVVSPEGHSSIKQRATVGKTVNYNTDPYTASLPSNPYGTPSTVSPFEYRFWVECHDSQHRFGRISTQNTLGSGNGTYWHYNPHFEKFTLSEAVSVSVTSMSAYVLTTSSGAILHCAIYNDNGAGSPHPIGATLVAQTNDLTGAVSGTWATFTFPGPVTLAPGTYWLAIISDTDIATPVSQAGTLVAPNVLGGSPADFTFPTPLPAAGYASLFDQTPLGISLYASYDLITAVDPATALVPSPQPVMPGRPIHVRPY